VRHPLRTLLVALAAVVVLAAAGVAFYLVVLRDDPPKRVALTPESETTEPAEGAAASPAGSWVVRTGDDSFVGYRVRETFAGLSVASDAVGRTNDVSGTLTVEGDTTVTTAEVTAGLEALESDEERRDNAIRTRGLETERFPESTFTLTGPLELPSPPTAGEAVSVTATGDLTLHGVTRPVDVPVEARWNGSTIEVVGNIDVTFSDYDIEAPSVGGFVSVEDEGEIELQLTFVPA
jgi:polyisoprenoid-binding protein YceI